MKQTIIALVRPNLNLAQKESQAAHLIEHILLDPKRLLKMGFSDEFYSQNVINHGGHVNDFYVVEYYVVLSEAADFVAKAISENQNELYLAEADFEKIKATMLEELLEDRGEFINTGEQLTHAMFTPDSPTIRNEWSDIESVKDITFEEAKNIFQKYNTDISLLRLSYDECIIDQLPKLESNVLQEIEKTVSLTHPWQSPGSVDTTLIIPMTDNTNYILDPIYRLSLTDFRFGLLFDEIRNKEGLVYDISFDINYNADNYYEFFFSSTDENASKVTAIIKQSLEKYEDFITKNLEYIKQRYVINSELDWGDIQGNYLNYIDKVISRRAIISSKEMIEAVKKITAKDLIDYNQKFLKAYNAKVLTFKLRHGKEIKTVG